jgi:LPXTG-site transpeptidase (sortase) family protein
VGYLDGTAYPTWPGNTVLTAHVSDSNGLPGPFFGLKDLTWGEEIVIHSNGARYVYDVRSVSNWTSPSDTRSISQHEDFDWLTLVTCQGFDESLQSYRWRTVVRAVLVSVKPESDHRR